MYNNAKTFDIIVEKPGLIKIYNKRDRTYLTFFNNFKVFYYQFTIPEGIFKGQENKGKVKKCGKGKSKENGQNEGKIKEKNKNYSFIIISPN